MVEIGNETNSGMLWPTGSISFSGSTASQQATWKNYGSLVISAVNAVHAAQGAGPKVQISLTIGNGNSSGEPAYFYGNLFNTSWGDVPASDIDVMGVDYYPTTHDISTLSSNITALSTAIPNKNIMVMETDAPWVSNSNARTSVTIRTTPEHQAGQAAYLSALASTLQGLPNVMGLLYWYPEAVQVPGYNIYNGGDDWHCSTPAATRCSRWSARQARAAAATVPSASPSISGISLDREPGKPAETGPIHPRTAAMSKPIFSA